MDKIPVLTYNWDVKNLSLLNDIIFKHVFGTESNKPLLICLLNAILGYAGKGRITEIQILNPFSDRECPDEKLVILDIKASDGQGRLFNIEVQLAPKAGYIGRVIYYLAKLYSGQLEPGESFTRLAKTIGISILDFTLFENTCDLHNIYRLLNTQSHHELTDILELHFIELVKFDRYKPHELRTPFEKWLYLLKFGDLYGNMLEPIPQELKEEEGIVMAIDAYRKASSDNYVRQLIELREKAAHDAATDREEAREKGRAEGHADVARRMKELGFDTTAIMRATGLSEEEISGLFT
jgi:predicted transposase/invertase (TIGR01784 family)